MNETEKSICDNICLIIQDGLRSVCDPIIFSKTTFIELGEFYYNFIISNVEGANIELINAVVSTMYLPSSCDNQNKYYEKLCRILGFQQLPGDIIFNVRDEFNQLINKHNKVKQKYEQEINRLRYELSQIKSKSDSIKNKEVSYSILRDISEDEEQLYALCSQCNSLRTRKEMLEYAFDYTETVLKGLCNLNDISDIDFAIRKVAMLISQENNEAIRKNYFNIYRNCLELFEDDIDREYMIFFKVKIYTAIEIANRQYHSLSLQYTDEEAVEFYKNYISKIPKIDDLQLWRTSDLVQYSESLSGLIKDYGLIDYVEELINDSVCLRQRNEILLKSVELFKRKEYQVFNNLISIQIEGMFADYLRDTTTFLRFTHMQIYEYNVLKEKIRLLRENNSDMYPETTEYFMFYFNNMIRNKVAHGRYYGNKTKISDEIFSKELFLDLCLLVHMLVRTSETERMYRFIHKYQEYYQKLINETEHPSFGALFNDMIGQKIIFEYDGMRSYRPIQVAYWIVNPYYEKIYEQINDKSNLLSLRDEFLSTEFWEYVYERLTEVEKIGYDYLNINSEFPSVIKSLFRCNITDKTKQVLGKVNALTTKIFKLMK